MAAFSAAVELGLLDRIGRAPADPPELAGTCGADERGVRLLLAGLANLHPMIPLWNRLPDAVRTGRPVSDPNPAPAALLTGLCGGTVEHAAAALPGADRVLDVAAGAAPWRIA